jgi:hypothetical protein
MKKINIKMSEKLLELAVLSGQKFEEKRQNAKKNSYKILNQDLTLRERQKFSGRAA